MMLRARHKAPVIYLYGDFRLYLKDLARFLRDTDSAFTVRSFSAKAGFGSPSFLKMVIDGERNLTSDSLARFCQALGIAGPEKKYFETMVDYGQCVDPDRKNALLDELVGLRPHEIFSKIRKSQFKYLTQPTYACIREMVLLRDFREDPKWIAARCVPRINTAAAREAIKTLIGLGMLRRDESGTLVQTQAVIDTDEQVAMPVAYRFHEAVLDTARRSLALLKQSERNFSALTIPVSVKLIKEVERTIHECENRILALINEGVPEYDEVYQLNFQFFPITKKAGGHEDIP
jgi:uncharacterized protein (TIGR02147 family)